MGRQLESVEVNSRHGKHHRSSLQNQESDQNSVSKSLNPAVLDKDSKQSAQESTSKLNQLKNEILESLERLLQDESTTDEKEMLPLMNQQETEIRE